MEVNQQFDWTPPKRARPRPLPVIPTSSSFQDAVRSLASPTSSTKTKQTPTLSDLPRVTRRSRTVTVHSTSTSAALQSSYAPTRPSTSTSTSTSSLPYEEEPTIVGIHTNVPLSTVDTNVDMKLFKWKKNSEKQAAKKAATLATPSPFPPQGQGRGGGGGGNDPLEEKDPPE